MILTSSINAFSVEDSYTSEFSKYFQENTGYWQEPNPHEYLVEQVATSPTKKKKPTHNRQKRTIQSDDAPRQTAWTIEEEIALKDSGVEDEDYIQMQEIAIPKFARESRGGSTRHKSSGSSSFNIESEEPNINLNTNVGDNNEDGVREIRRPEGRDKARAAGKNKGSKASGSSTMNEDALARLMREDLDRDGERRFDYLTFALVWSKASHEGCRPSRGGFPYILCCMICKREDHRTSDHEMYIASLIKSKNYKAQPYQNASTSKQILKAKAKPYSPYTNCGFNDHSLMIVETTLSVKYVEVMITLPHDTIVSFTSEEEY
nr:retrovirus-related Pol polyprotein from transposon TNT 1-94 [Tanacetum cinerariifolium]